MKCVSCDNPLVCADCGKPFVMTDAKHHQAAYESETALTCPACDAPLVCRWCGHSYSGDESEFGEE